MRPEDLIQYARRELEEISFPTSPAYRCAVYLTDGLYLPCVVLGSERELVDLAIRRFAEIQEEQDLIPAPRSRPRRPRSGLTYREIVSTFAAQGNSLNHYDIARVERSPYALSLARLREIKGETSMSWTQFVGVMSDGKEFSFGTTFLNEFYSMPEGYTAADVERILPHETRGDPVYRERPYFVCYLPGL